MEEGKYLSLWHKYLPVVRLKLKKSLNEEQSLKLTRHEFEATGDRKASGYSFNLELKKGKVTNDITGTAVARDLYKTLIDDASIKDFLKDKKIKINMGNAFVLKIMTSV